MPRKHEPTQSEPPAEAFDVVILGGGINGCGTFRDLCAQGVRCLLIERDDFCAGASGASSRLMHGGLKYLEAGEFRLVRQSAEERNLLLRNAPHYVSPLPCIVPVRSHFGGILASAAKFLRLPARLRDRGLVITTLGLTLYDIYGRRFRAMPAHRILSRRALRREMPDLDPGIVGAGLYFEGQISRAERLGLELVLDGEALEPASRAVNHAKLLGADGDLIRWRDRRGTHAARAAVVINAGGAWIDAVNARLGIPTHHMGGSKGSHLVVNNPRLHAALKGRMIYFGSSDGRVNLVYPFLDRVLVGSTDIAVSDFDTAVCDADERAYLQRLVTEVFPSIPIRDEEIVYSFCGVRPLPRSDGEIGGVTRDHSIARDTLPGTDIPVLSLIGGKWTTFRGFSEEAADRALEHLGCARRTRTVEMAIGGGLDWPATLDARAEWIATAAAMTGVAPARLETLLERYGTRAHAIAASLGKGERMLPSLPGYSEEELTHLARTEKVGTADDLLRRRTTISLTGYATPDAVADVERLLAAELEGDTRHAIASEATARPCGAAPSLAPADGHAGSPRRSEPCPRPTRLADAPRPRPPVA
jgi:glycerol-3-phosphate dehydrogenase